MPKTRVGSVTLDQNLYPRHGVDWVHVAHLADALKAGAEFPPIEVSDRGVLIDGRHRLEAYRRLYGDDHIIEVNVIRLSGPKLLMRAAQINSRHGLRLSPQDQARTAHALLEAGIKPERVAEVLSVSRERLDGLIARVVSLGPQTGRVEVLKRPMFSALATVPAPVLTETHLRANEVVSGAPALSLARQLLAHLEARTYPTSREGLEVLWKLARLASVYGLPDTQSEGSHRDAA